MLLLSFHSDDEKKIYDDKTIRRRRRDSPRWSLTTYCAAQPAVVVLKDTVDRSALARVGTRPVQPKKGNTLCWQRNCSRSADRWTATDDRHHMPTSTQQGSLQRAPYPVSEGVHQMIRWSKQSVLGTNRVQHQLHHRRRKLTVILHGISSWFGLVWTDVVTRPARNCPYLKGEHSCYGHPVL